MGIVISRRSNILQLFLSIVFLALPACKAEVKVNNNCGDTILDPGEQCDGSNLTESSCESLGFHKTEGVLQCTSSCQFDTADCGLARCGDEAIQTIYGEQCDGADLGGASCVTEGYERGTLGCSDSCRFDLSGCEGAGRCGDGVLQSAANEQCDGNQLDDSTCESLGFHGGILACDTSCQFDTTGCLGRCGDSTVQVQFGETCDGSNLQEKTCLTENYYAGTLACNEDCTLDFTSCAEAGRCGDGVVQTAYLEECDGVDFHGNTCESLGHTYGGVLTCTNACQIDITACEGFCGDGYADASNNEVCDGLDFLGKSTCGDFGFFNPRMPDSLACDGTCNPVIEGCTNFIQWGSSAHDYSSGIATDQNHNLILAGETVGSLEGTNAGLSDFVVVKLDPVGHTTWTRQWGNANLNSCNAIATDSAGNIIVAGYTEGSTDGSPALGSYDIYLAKLYPDSSLAWSVQTGTGSVDSAHGIAVDSFENLYVVGYVHGSLDGNPYLGGSDCVLIKYNTYGTRQWTRQWGSSGSENAMSVAIDGSGNVYITGDTNGAMDGGSNLGGTDVFLTKFNADGTLLWTRQWGSAGSEYSYGVKTDSAGDVFVSGRTSGTLDGNTSAGGYDAFVTKYNSSGTRLWTRQWGSSGSDGATRMAVDASGDVLVTGWAAGSFFGNPWFGGDDIFLTKYDTAGNHIATQQWGTSSGESGSAVTIDSTGEVYLVGHTQGTLAPSSGLGWDLFVLRI